MDSSYYAREIKRLKEDLERENRIENNKLCAEQVREIWQSYVAVGFTEEQAWELLTILLKKNI